jgi:hypothetical protein
MGCRGAVAQIEQVKSGRTRVLREVRDSDQVAMIDVPAVALQGIERAAQQGGRDARRGLRAGPLSAGSLHTGGDAGKTGQSDSYERSARELQNPYSLPPGRPPAGRVRDGLN